MRSIEISKPARLSIIALAILLVASFSSGCKKSLSPTDTVKAYYDASVKKDVAGIKRTLSKGTIALMEEGAKAMKKSLDDALKESANSNPPPASPTFSNEKIDGDTATVDIAAGSEKLTMPLVKEDGEWKLAFDKLMMGGGMRGGSTGPDIGGPPPPRMGDTSPPPTMGDDEEDHDH